MAERLECFQKTFSKFTDSPCGLVPKSNWNQNNPVSKFVQTGANYLKVPTCLFCRLRILASRIMRAVVSLPRLLPPWRDKKKSSKACLRLGRLLLKSPPYNGTDITHVTCKACQGLQPFESDICFAVNKTQTNKIIKNAKHA